MTDFTKFKAGDIMKLKVALTIEHSPHCSCCSPDYDNMHITAEFKILQVVKRNNDFIFIFERSNIFEDCGNITDDSRPTLVNFFILDTSDTDLEYENIIVLDEDEEKREKLERIKILKKIIKDTSESNEQYRAEYLELTAQLDALINFPQSKAYGLILNRMTEINLQINNIKESLITATNELKILKNTQTI